MKSRHQQLKALAIALCGQINRLIPSLPEPIKVGQAQELIARTGGFKTWAALIHVMQRQQVHPGNVPDASSSQAAAPLPVEKVPTAWSYELGTRMNADGSYDGWEKRLTATRPQVPEGSIRDLVPLGAIGEVEHPSDLPVLDGDEGDLEAYGNASSREEALAIGREHFPDPVVDAYVAENVLVQGDVIPKAWVVVTEPCHKAMQKRDTFANLYAYQAKVESHPVMQLVLRRVLETFEAVKEVRNIVHRTSLQDRKNSANASHFEHDGQVVRDILPPMIRSIEGDLRCDEECLPMYRVRFADGQEITLFDDELHCEDSRLEAFFEATSGAFGQAKLLGFSGPWDLAAHGTPEDHEQFMKAYAAS